VKMADLHDGDTLSVGRVDLIVSRSDAESKVSGL
jgi:hypothetical protein